jgi:hypothetical protein
MAEGVTTAAIEVIATGGEKSAAELAKPAQGLANTGKEAENTGKKMRAAGGSFRDFRGAVDLLAPGTSAALEALKDMKEGAEFLSASVGKAFPKIAAAAGPVGVAVAGALAVTVGLWMANKKAADDMAKAVEKNLGTHRELIKGFGDAQKSGVKLTAAQREYITVLKRQTEHERELTIAQLKRQIVTAQEASAMGTYWTQVKLYWASALGLHAVEAKLVEDKRLATVETARLRAELESWIKTGKPLKEAIVDEGKALDITKDKVKEYAAAIREAAKGAVPEGKWDEAREDVIEWAKAEYEALDQAKAGTEAYARLREATNAKLRKIDRDAAREFKKEWLGALDAVTGPLTTLGVGLMESMRKGTDSAKQVFTKFRDAIVTMIEEMIAKAVMFGLISAAFGGAGGFMGGAKTGLFGGGLGALFGGGKQFGGEVPGPEGAPALVLAHGGESVTRGTAGPQGGGGSSMTLNFQGGIGGLNPADQRIIGRQMRGLIRMGGDLGLV